MVAKATQNLFDVSVGGAGFHFTSHLIALVALFIACFAIAGYVMFRNDSIPASALKDGDPDFEDINATSLTLSGDLTVGGAFAANKQAFLSGTITIVNTANTATSILLGTQPANSFIKNIYLTPTSTLTTAGALNDNLVFSLGTTSAGIEIINEVAILDDGGAPVTATSGFALPLVENGIVSTANTLNKYQGTNPATSEAVAFVETTQTTTTARSLYATLEPEANALAASGSVSVLVECIYA